MPATSDQDLTITCGWGNGRTCRFLSFADGLGGLSCQHVGPSTTVITALPRKGDALVEMDGQQYACWFRNLDPFPAEVIVVDERFADSDLDDVDRLERITDLGIRLLPKDHKAVCSRLKRIVARYGEFAWVHYGHNAPVLVVGVTPSSTASTITPPNRR